MPQTWVHGNVAKLERNGSPNANSKQTVQAAFRDDKWDGDIVDLGDWGAVACLRIGWAARFVVFDNGFDDRPKSGSFWCHFPIPNRVEAPDRGLPEAEGVLLNYESTDVQALAPIQVHVWDGNRRIFEDNDADISTVDFNGGIRGATLSPGDRPDLRKLWHGRFRSPVFFGIVVSILIRAHDAQNDQLEIRGVGIQFA